MPGRSVEIVSLAGFEQYFRDLTHVGSDIAQLERVNEQYAIDMDFDSIAKLCEQFGLRFPQF